MNGASSDAASNAQGPQTLKASPVSTGAVSPSTILERLCHVTGELLRTEAVRPSVRTRCRGHVCRGEYRDHPRTHTLCSAMPLPKWLKIRNAAPETSGPVELLIYGQIGVDWLDRSGVEAEAFVEALRGVPASREIIVGLHSPGGCVWDGLAIYNHLKSRQARVTIRIDGIAASIASVIAMAGSRIVMAPSSRLMVHNPLAMSVGGSGSPA